MGKLDGKVALITGGSSGIGLATAQAFIREGADVYLVGRNETALQSAVRRLGPHAVGVAADVTRLPDLDRLFNQIKVERGELQIVFANAGWAEFVGIESVTEEHYARIFDVNVKGPLFTINKALPLLSSNASIILNSGVGATKAIPNFSVYSAAKNALVALGRCLAADLKGRGIRVNVVCPGVIPTEMYQHFGLSEDAMAAFTRSLTDKIPSARAGSPAEVAEAVVFLASDTSSYVNAHELRVDGGYSQV